MGIEMREALVRFLDALDAINVDHPEVTDTDVRIQLAEIIQDRLITNADELNVSNVFGMFSDVGNQLVQSALASYLDEAVPLSEALGLDAKTRLTAVWDFEARSHNGTPVVDYLSYGPPEWPDRSEV